jgi:transcriptional antiterminator RfaH
MENWHIVHTKPGHERQVAVHLHHRGIEVYLPLMWGSTGSLPAPRARAYFPGYLFARIDLLAAGPQAIRWSPGLRGLVEDGGEPITVTVGFIAELKQRLSRVRAVGGMTFDGSRLAELVCISDGPFAGFEAIFNAQLGGPERARVLLACAHRESWKTNGKPPPAAVSRGKVRRIPPSD